LRTNIIIGGVAGFAKRESPCGCRRIGDVTIGVQDLRDRRVMTSFDPDTLAQDKEITRAIYRRFEGKLALHFLMIEGGEIAVRNEAQLGPGRGRACANQQVFHRQRASSSS
jgi:hypothetical protein